MFSSCTKQSSKTLLNAKPVLDIRTCQIKKLKFGELWKKWTVVFLKKGNE